MPSRRSNGPTIDYGLASSVADLDRKATKVASRLDMAAPGSAHFTLVNEMPHGGVKMSGYGKDMSLYGLEDYTVLQRDGELG